MRLFVPLALVQKVSFYVILIIMKKLINLIKQFLHGDTGSELVRYGIAGVSTTLGNYLLFALLSAIGLEYKPANLITLIIVKTAAYLLNKLYVYRSRNRSTKDTTVELLRYIISRAFTGALDYFGLILFVDRLEINKYISKAVVMAAVIIINYILGKFFVFTKKSAKAEETMTEVQPEGNYYDKYASKNPIEKAMMSGFFNTVRKALASTGAAYDSIYDAGCGEGHFTEYLRKWYPAAGITASDISETKIEGARMEYRELNINFEVSDIYRLDTSRKFSLVTCSEVLEHLENPGEALKEFEQMSTGYVLVTVPHEPIWRILNMCRFKYLKRWGNTPGHIQHWSKRAFKKLIKKNTSMEIVAATGSLPWLIFLLKR